MYQHPALLEALTRERAAGLRRHGAGETARSRGQKRPRKLVAAARRGTGWMLVDMGLRLAVPRGGTSHPVARGQR